MSVSDRVLGPSGERRRRRLLIVTLAALAAALIIAAAQATPPEQNPPGYFELDKNVINNEQTPSVNTGTAQNPNFKTLGSLGGNINASVTSFTVCQNTSTNPATSQANPITIQVDAERMTVGTITNASGGGCSGQFKRTYSNVTRGPVNGGGAAASHGASGVSGYVTQVTFNNTVGDDWDQVKAAVDANNALDPDDQADNPCSVFTGSGWTGNTDAVACDFIHDPPGQTVFSTGGSKDDLDINTGTPPNLTPSWKYTNQSVPDADDITDGYAIKYQQPDDVNNPNDGHQFLYFGADRTAVNGAKDMGFWFFKNEVGLNGDGTFSGQHTVGDLLLLGTFTNGGAATTIRVFKWDPANADTNGVLDSAPGNFGDCVPGGQANGCNTVNNGTIKSDGWTYQSKISGTPANTIYAGGAMEGGVDLSSLGLTGCFSTFLAETRSSPEVGAQLKDFLIGKFEACASALTTTPKDGNGDPIPDGGLSIGTGTVTAKDSADLDVTGAEEWKGKFDYYLCGPVSTDGCEPTSGNTGGVHVGPTQNVDQDNPPTLSAAATITEVGRYCWRGVFTSETQGVDSQTDDSSDECFDVNPVTPTLTTTAVEPFVGLSPTIIDGLADLNGDGVVNGDDDSSAFYGDTSIIDGHLDCDGWTSDNDGAAGDGEINGVNGSDDCTLIGVPSVTIDVVGGEFQTADGPLPKVFNAAQPNNTDIGDSDFAWSTIDGKVDSNGNEAIGGTDCSFNVIGDADILGNDASCGSGGSNPNFTNGKVDLNGDGKITSDDSCTDGCFLGHDVANGLIVNGTIPFGQALYDIATLTGTATQPGSGGPSTTYPSINPTVPGAPADGTITFTLVGPDGQTTDCTTLAQSDNAPPDVNPEDVGVSGDGDYQTSGFTPDAPGDYHWKASYTGSPPADPGPPPVSPLNTLGTSHNDDCTEAGENVTVEQIPTSIATRQRVYPNDAAQIASTKAGDNLPAGGTVTFRLYEAGGGNTALQNCQAHGTTLGSGGLIYEEPVDVTGGQHSENVSTSNTSRPVAANATVYWWVTYNTGDSAHTGRQSNCQENTSVTFVNDAGPGTLFSP